MTFHTAFQLFAVIAYGGFLVAMWCLPKGME